VYLEETWNCIRSFPDAKVGGIIVIDITDCGMSFLSFVSVLTKICSSGILRYPEISEKVFIINAGWLITTLWAAIKPFIPSRTEEKLTILGTNYLVTLSDALFGTSDTSSSREGMAQLQSLLSSPSSPTSSSTSLQISSEITIHTVESAYDSILNDIFRSFAGCEDDGTNLAHISITTTETKSTTTETDSPLFLPDTREFLEAARGFIERHPSSRLRSAHSERIDDLLSRLA
jgi:hypothetical protein